MLGGARPTQRNTGVFVLKELKIWGLKGGSKALHAAWSELVWSRGKGTVEAGQP